MTTVEDHDEESYDRLLLCADCNTPYVAKRFPNGEAIPLGISQCTQCGGDAFVRPASGAFEANGPGDGRVEN